MKTSDKELTRQETDIINIGENENDGSYDDNRFGNWPELLGVIFTALVTWMIFEFRG